jgi:hypothetical protein
LPKRSVNHQQGSPSRTLAGSAEVFLAVGQGAAGRRRQRHADDMAFALELLPIDDLGAAVDLMRKGDRPAGCLFFVRLEGYTGGRHQSAALDRLAPSSIVKVAA